VELALPYALGLDEAVRINAECQRFDGIDRIDPDGTVHFAEREMEIMKDMIGYSCARMHVEEAGARADELCAKYREFARKNGVV
jgi:hypothetical protein